MTLFDVSQPGGSSCVAAAIRLAPPRRAVRLAGGFRAGPVFDCVLEYISWM
jgi:hypothetical protein